MRIEELSTGTTITLLANVNGEQLSFESKIEEVHPQKHLVLAAPILHDEKVISFQGNNVKVHMLASMPDDKPQVFHNISVTTLKKQDDSICYNLAALNEGRPYNRRESFRCFLGIPTVMRCGANSSARDTLLRDISMSGFSLTFNEDTTLAVDQVVHVVLNDYIEELTENFSFQIYGIIVRVQELENGKFVYGCRITNRVIGLESYIMKKERVRLRKNSGR